MNSFFRSLSVDLKRSIFSRSFLTMIVLLFVMQFLNTISTVTTHLIVGTSWEYLLDRAFNGDFTEMVFCIAATGYAWSYCVDHKSGFFQQAVQRVGIRSYCLSRIVSVAVSAFLATVVSMGLFVLFSMALTSGNIVDKSYYRNMGYMDLVADGKSGLYFAVSCTHMGLACSAIALTGLVVSAYTPNTYMTVFAPLLISMLVQAVNGIVGMQMQWSLHGILFGYSNFGSVAATFGVCSILILCGMVLLGDLFYHRVEKRR